MSEIVIKKISKYYALIMILLGIIFMTIYFSNLNPANAQARLDLDDVMVKGELQNDERLVILSREKNELRNYVKFRVNYRTEMIEELPQPAPGIKY